MANSVQSNRGGEDRPAIGSHGDPMIGEPCACRLVACRRQIANSITAVLLHAEAIRRHSRALDKPSEEINISAEHIICNAMQVWNALEGASIGFERSFVTTPPE